ncbi:MAG TPA: hypothetical protein VKE51_09635 [Vicinamibacterales bacterium]|nr:hypothetical protein [Vicinamibacterales bacterium]
MTVLSFAAVGFHGREWWPRLTLAALALTPLSMPASAQPTAAFVDLASEFAASIAGALGPAAAVRLTFAPDPSRVEAEVVRLLAARGVRVTDSADATPVAAACATNLRERVCAAEIGRGAARRVVMTTRPRGGAADGDADPIVAIELRPIYTQRRPMLDVATAGDQLLVLSSESVTLVAGATPADLGGRPTASKPITTARVWPRDVRGRLRVVGPTFAAFLPGVTCRGTINPFTLVCADEIEPWPIGLDNSGIAPSRNAFSTADGFAFYEVAPLDRGRFLLVSERSALTILDNGRRTAARGETADHAAGFLESCAAAPYVALDGRTSDAGADTLRLFRVTDTRLVAQSSTVTVPGALITLWSATDTGPATAIVHDLNAGRYEAFQIALSCAR